MALNSTANLGEGKAEQFLAMALHRVDGFGEATAGSGHDSRGVGMERPRKVSQSNGEVPCDLENQRNGLVPLRRATASKAMEWHRNDLHWLRQRHGAKQGDGKAKSRLEKHSNGMASLVESCDGVANQREALAEHITATLGCAAAVRGEAKQWHGSDQQRIANSNK